MPLKQLTPPAAAAIDLADVKAQLRIESGFTADDDLLAGYIGAFTGMIDGPKGLLARALITQSWELSLPRFPRAGEHGITIPLPPIQQINEITYLDPAGAEQTLSSDRYFLDSASEPARVFPAYDTCWPETRFQAGAVKIDFTAGFGDAASDIPDQIRQAGLLMISDWYDNRGNITRQSVNDLPFAANALLGPWKVDKLEGIEQIGFDEYGEYQWRC